MAEDYIFTENMTVGYGKMPLIAQIEIHVKRGQIVTLIGPCLLYTSDAADE